jgi:hypothetical protein
MAMEAPRRSGRFNFPFVHKSTSFDVPPDAFSFFPLRPPPQQFWEEDDQEDSCCWLPELTEPEEVKLFKSSQEVVMEERGEKERSRSFDVQDLSSSPRPRPPAGAQPPKRLTLAYGPSELSKALQALMSLQEQSESEVKSDSEDEECRLKKKEKRRSRHRRSFLSLLLRRTASD